MTEGEVAPAQRLGSAQLAILVVVLLTGTLRWHHTILEDYPKPDEVIYVKAAELWSAGRSPYEEGRFFYTPVFAWTAAKLTELYTSLGYLRIQRTMNLLGICVATWLAVLIARWRTWPALGVSVLWICLSPGVALSIELGNATGVPTALTLVGLWIWLRRPHLAGLSLGFAQVIKPIAPLAALCLLVRKGFEQGRSLRAGLVSIAATAVVLLVGLRFLPDLLGNAAGSGNPYNFALPHLLGGFGVTLEPVWVTATLGAGGLWWISRHRLSRSEVLVATLTLNLLAAPILWVHSLLLFLPVQLLAAARLARSLRSLETRGTGARRRAVLPHIIAGLALASTVFSGASGGLLTAPTWLQSAVLAVPYLSLLYLGVYAFQGLPGDDDARHSRPSQAA